VILSIHAATDHAADITHSIILVLGFHNHIMWLPVDFTCTQDHIQC